MTFARVCWIGAWAIRKWANIAALPLNRRRAKHWKLDLGLRLNLPHYPQTVTRLTVIDSENTTRNVTQLVDRRIAECALPVTKMQLDAQGRLPFEDHSFDSVVTTLGRFVRLKTRTGAGRNIGN